MKQFNKLTAAEQERLALLSEEMGEVQQVIGKILRHGYESYHPRNKDHSNRDLLEKELGDVHAVLALMENEGDVNGESIDYFKEDKLKRVGKYLHHNVLALKKCLKHLGLVA